MKDKPARALAFWLLALATSVAARADLVYLTDGSVVEGEVTYVGNMVRIRKTSGITVSHPKHMVRKVVKSVSAAEEYRKRSEAVEPDDAEGLLDLARWCRKQKNLDTEAEAAYRAVLGIASPVYREAKREFAKLLRQKKRLKEAHTLYCELGDEAARDAAGVRSELDKLRAGAYDKGQRRLLSKDLREALLEFQRALNFTPAGAPAGNAAVTEADVLAKIVEVRKGYFESITPPLIQLDPCESCGGTCLVACRPCGGQGRVRRLAQIMTKGRMEMLPRWFPCDTCRGGGRVRCDSCAGASIDISRLGPAKAAVRSVASTAVSCSKGSLAGTVKRMNQVATKRRMAFAPGEVPYTTSSHLRKLLPGVPAAAGEFRALRPDWRTADGATRLNLLANYVLETAMQLSHFSVSAYKEPADAAKLGLDEAEPGDATRMSAFPDMAAGPVCRIPCVWRGAAGADAEVETETDAEPEAETESEAGMGAETETYEIALDVETEGPHTLRPFVWKDSARPAMERLGDVLGLPGLSTRAATYPFPDVLAAVRARRKGDRVELVGRLLFDTEPAQTWRFEVWRITPRLDEATERMIAVLSRRVSFRFRDTPINGAAEMLSDLTGARIEVEVPKRAGITVTCRARKLPLGHALDRMLGEVNLGWKLGTIDVARIRIVQKTSRAERARTEELLRLIPPALER
jgi:hypothetical protein